MALAVADLVGFIAARAEEGDVFQVGVVAGEEEAEGVVAEEQAEKGNADKGNTIRGMCLSAYIPVNVLCHADSRLSARIGSRYLLKCDLELSAPIKFEIADGEMESLTFVGLVEFDGFFRQHFLGETLVHLDFFPFCLLFWVECSFSFALQHFFHL